MKILKKLLCILTVFYSDINASGQPYTIHNTYNEKNPQTLYKYYYNSIFINNAKQKEYESVIDTFEIPTNKDFAVYQLGHPYTYFIKILNEKCRSLPVKINGKMVSLKFTLSDEIMAPDIKIGKTGCFPRVIDSVSCISHFDDDANFKHAHYEVISYEIELTRKGKIYYKETAKGNQFSADFRKNYGQSITSDKIILKNIIVIDERKNTITIPKKEFTVR